MLKKPEKKIYIAVSFLVLLLAALGMVIATGWDSSKASHSTLYTDEIRGKSGVNINVNDNLNLNGPLEVNGIMEQTSNDISNPGIYSSVIGSPQAILAESDSGFTGEIASSSHSSGVYGSSPSWGYGIKGENDAGPSGYIGGLSYGVYGKSSSSGSFNQGYLGGSAYGVYGKASNTAGFGEAGIRAETASINGAYAMDVYHGAGGTALNIRTDNGNENTIVLDVMAAGLQAGLSARFRGGQGVSIPDSGLCIDSDGSCTPPAPGYAKSLGWETGASDLAENFETKDKLEAGDVVVISGEAVEKSSKAYDKMVAGIVATKPGVLLGDEIKGSPLALAGRVPTKVSTENGPIEVGDLLTTSNTPGYAMKCTDMQKCFGALVGKALEPLDKGTGKIKVLVALG